MPHDGVQKPMSATKEQIDKERKQKLKELMQRLKINLRNLALLNEALTHPSYCAEHKGVTSNQRLEFLGDSVLGLIVTKYLFERFPELSEGELTKVRATAVSEKVLSQVAKEIGLGEFLLLSKGEDQIGGRKRPSILADAFEALVGAIFVEKGLKATADFVLSLLSKRIELIRDNHIIIDYKSRLQELAQRYFKATPTYRVITECGPEHNRTFTVAVYIGQKYISTGKGKSKREAEHDAARMALEKLSKQAAKVK
ncbi:MAG: hypothetical protein RUDDFDWM_001851 [Candidatus Fervidibacterota bacterium]